MGMATPRNYRLTSQRQTLLGLIRQQGGHLDATELYRRAQELQPRISLSTVYRAMHFFKQLGLIEEHRFEQDHLHYEAKPKVEHCHLICLRCGRISEFQSPQTEKLKKEVEHEKNFKVASIQIHLQGYCHQCQGKQFFEVDNRE